MSIELTRRIASRGLCAVLLALAACGSGEDGTCNPIDAALVERIEVAPSSSIVTPGETLPLSATAFSCAGPLASVPFTWQSEDTAIASVSVAGVVSGITPGGPVQVTARAQGKQGAASISVGNVPVASVTVTPHPTTVGVGRTAQLSAVPRDAQGGELSGRAVAWSSADEALATVSPSGLVTGVAAGGPVAITATIEGVAGSSQVTVSLVPVATVTVAPPASTIASGGTVQLTATLRGGEGSVLTGRTVAWSSSNDQVALVSATGLVTGLGAGGPVTITATSEGRSGTAQVTVTVGAATRLVYIQQPSNVAAGSSIAPAIVVEAQDAGGNRVTTFGGPIALQVLNNPGGAILAGSTTVSAVSGRATFNNISLNRPGTGYTLAATSGSLAVTSNAFNVTPGAPARLAFITGPSDAVAGEAIAPAVQVEIRDAQDNRTTSTAQVRVALVNPPGGGGTLGGTVQVNAVAGVATFSTLSVDRAASGYTLTATSGTLAPAASAAFAVSPGRADRLVFLNSPADVTPGQPMDPPIRVEARDASGNIDPTFTGPVLLRLEGGPLDAALSGTTQMNAVAGVATFASVAVNRSGTGFTLVAEAGGVASGTSAPFAVAAPTPASLFFLVQPTDVDENDPITPAPQVEVRDALGNRILSFTSTVTVIVRGANGSGNPPSGTTLSGTTAVNAVAGVATFTNLRVSVSQDRNNLTLRATIASPPLFVVSSQFDVDND